MGEKEGENVRIDDHKSARVQECKTKIQSRFLS
jgi:hypothetical protein